MENWKKYLAEFMGTLILVLVAVEVAIQTGGSLVPTALAFGLVLIALCYTIGDVSGCHVNPAVSLALYINKKMTTIDFCFYVLAQILGAIAAGAILYGLHNGQIGGTNGYINLGDTANQGLWNFTGIWKGLLIEIAATFIFVLTVLSVTRKGDYKFAGIVIGLTLAVVHLFAINLTGTSVNPARSLGVAIFDSAALEQVWLFIVAPLIGGALAALFARCLHKDDEIVGDAE